MPAATIGKLLFFVIPVEFPLQLVENLSQVFFGHFGYVQITSI